MEKPKKIPKRQEAYWTEEEKKLYINKGINLKDIHPLVLKNTLTKDEKQELNQYELELRTRLMRRRNRKEFWNRQPEEVKQERRLKLEEASKSFKKNKNEK